MTAAPRPTLFLILLVLAAAFGLSVFALNGHALYYFDTAAYITQGDSALASVGLGADYGSMQEAGTVAPAQDDAEADASVDGSRSAIYSLALALLNAAGLLDAAVFLNLALITLATWLLARRLCPAGAPFPCAAALTAAGLVAASLGSLSFYVAFLMPDILAPVLILALAVLFAHAPVMPKADIALAIFLALGAIVTHPSHLVMAVLILPVGVVLSPAVSGRRLWLIVFLAMALVGVGLAERFVFRAVVEEFQHSEVTYLPFLSARLIDDGPGMDYLDRNCPNPDLPTCALVPALGMSDDPARLDAPNILFSKTPEAGSFRLLPEADQRAVAADHLNFAVKVVKDAPFAVTKAVLLNVLTQLSYTRIDMTLPDERQNATIARSFGKVAQNLHPGRLTTGNRGWTDPLGDFHQLLYLFSATVVIGFLVFPGSLSSVNRVMIGLVLLGIIVNALVCGAVSEPAHRYGARVMLLLPMLASMLVLARWAEVRAKLRAKAFGAGD